MRRILRSLRFRPCAERLFLSAGAGSRSSRWATTASAARAELSLGLPMKRYEARHDANMLVALGDNDYLGEPEVVSGPTGRGASAGRAGAGLRVARRAREPRLRARPRRLRAGDARDARAATTRAGSATRSSSSSTRTTSDDRQTRLARAAARGSSATWKIAVFHHPPYTCGGHAGNTDVARRWVPLFERYGVQLVLSGHDHNYQRFAARNGVTYVVHGGGGAGPLPAARLSSSAYPPRVRAPRRARLPLRRPRPPTGWTCPRSTCAAGPSTDRTSLAGHPRAAEG